MGHENLIVTDDGCLADAMRCRLEESGRSAIHVVPQNEAARLAENWSVKSTLFVDLRPDWVNDSTCELLDSLKAHSSRRTTMVAVADGYHDRHLAALTELLAVERIEDPSDRDRTQSCLSQLNGGRSIPERFVAEAGGTQISTYASNFVPVLQQLVRVAVHDVALLMVGETGTGKTTMAHVIHSLSGRRDQPFQNVACGALPKDLIESELFGHVRGAFTGADRGKMGRFEAAGRGTLLLDEIDVLGPQEQAKLLRVIETGEFELVGSTETRSSKARVIVASNVDLETLMNDMQFRSDLYYRLNVLEFRLPPLRERRVDVVPLAMEFINDCCREHGIEVQRIHQEFVDAIKRYHWPGNIRELKNQMQRAVLFSEGNELTLRDLSAAILRPNAAAQPHAAAEAANCSLNDMVAQSERQILEEQLRAHDYNRTATARTLGISRVGLYKKMRRYGMIKSKEIPKASSDRCSPNGRRPAFG